MSRWSPARRRIVVGRNGDRGVSGGDAQLGWSAPSGLSDGNTLTITTDGTYNFGTKPNGAKPRFLFDWRPNSTLDSAALSRDAYNTWTAQFSLQSGTTYAGGAGAAKYAMVADGNSQAPPQDVPYPDVGQTGVKWYMFKVWKTDLTGAEAYAAGGSAWNIKWTRLYSSSSGVQSTPYTANGGGQHATHLNVRVAMTGGTVYYGGTANPMLAEDWRTEELQIAASSDDDVADAEFHVYYEGRKYSPLTGDISHTAALPKATYPYRYASLMREQDILAAGAFYFDIWYIDDSWCRVVMSSESTWSDSTAGTHDRFIQIPTAWSSNQISVVLRDGGANGFVGKYLYIIDNTGSPVNTSGLQL